MTNDLSKDKILQAVKTPAVALSIIFAPIAYFSDFLPKQLKFLLPCGFALIFLLVALLSKDRANRALSLGLSMLWGIISVIVLFSGKFQ